MISKCCNARIKEKPYNSHYAYIPYTNLLYCSKCGCELKRQEIIDENINTKQSVKK